MHSEGGPRILIMLKPPHYAILPWQLLDRTEAMPGPARDLRCSAKRHVPYAIVVDDTRGAERDMQVQLLMHGQT